MTRLTALTLALAAPAAAPAASFGGYMSGFRDWWVHLFTTQDGFVMAGLGLGALCVFILSRGKWLNK